MLNFKAIDDFAKIIPDEESQEFFEYLFELLGPELTARAIAAIPGPILMSPVTAAYAVIWSDDFQIKALSTLANRVEGFK